MLLNSVNIEYLCGNYALSYRLCQGERILSGNGIRLLPPGSLLL